MRRIMELLSRQQRHTPNVGSTTASAASNNGITAPNNISTNSRKLANVTSGAAQNATHSSVSASSFSGVERLNINHNITANASTLLSGWVLSFVQRSNQSLHCFYCFICSFYDFFYVYLLFSITFN